MNRRRLLALVGTGAAALAGCVGDDDPGGGGTTPETDTDAPDDGTTTTDDGTTTTDDDRESLPEGCPTSQDLDVEWPTDMDAESAASFVEAYEAAYFREIEVGYDPESDFQAYNMGGDVTDPPEESDGGWTLHYSGSGAVYNPNILLEASTVEAPPDGVEVVPYADVEDTGLKAVLDEAAEGGEAQERLGVGGAEIDAHLDAFAALTDDFDRPTDRGDSGTLYVDVDGTVVEVEATVTSFHGDYWWQAWYYVDDHVVRRTDDEETDPRDGQLLECREG